MKYIFTLLLLTVFIFGYSQDEARGSVGKKIESNSEGSKYALVIGISNYNEEKLKLNYADNDAILFKDYLNKVEQIPNENISLLINENAASIAILREFKTLLKTTQANDVIYIYFAGHGDVVDDFGEKEGFLLASDANANQEYYAGGVIPLALLNNKIINSLTQKGAKVILVLDACRSGFIFQEGSQKNLGTIQAMFENSTKFLSCGPSELSYESGDLKHGYFTYYLVKGLIGNADTNTDKQIQYREIDDYLYDNVFTTVSKKYKQAQTPVVSTSNSRAILKNIDAKNNTISFENIKSELENTSKLVARSGIINSTNIAVNSVLEKFNTAIKNANFYGKSISAYEVYKSALKDATLPDGYTDKMKYKLIEKLSVSAQQLINKYIDGTEGLPKGREFIKQAKHLDICLKLMDKDDFLRDKIYTSKLLLESYAIIRNKNYAQYRIAKQKLNEALNIEPRAAYIHNALGLVYNSEQVYDSAHYHFEKAKTLINTWNNPVLNLGENFIDQYKYDDAKQTLNSSLGIQADNVDSYIKLGTINENQGKYQLATENYQKALELNPKNALVLQKISNIEKLKGNIKAAVEWKDKAFEIDSIKAISNYGLFNYIQDNLIDDKTAEQLLLNAIDDNPEISENYSQYADFLRVRKSKRSRLVLADSLYAIAIEKNPFNQWAYAGRGWLQYDLRQRKKSQSYFEKGISKNPNKPQSYFYYANFLNDVKNYKLAESYYLKAVEKDVNYLPSYTKLITLYNTTKQHNKSISLIKKLIAKNPEAPDYWNLLGKTYFSKGDFSQAINAYKEAVKLDNSYVKGFSDLGYSELQVNNYEAAKEHYLLATTYDPYKNKKSKIAEYILTQAKTKEKFGTPADALELYKLASEIDTSVDVVYEYAHYLYLNNNAEKGFDKAISIIPNCSTSKQKIKVLELLIKTSIDLNNTQNSTKYFKQLSSSYKTDYLLAAVYYKFIGDLNAYSQYINKVNPMLIRSTKLKAIYSASTIQNIILN